jgi:hypothetical protein
MWPAGELESDKSAKRGKGGVASALLAPAYAGGPDGKWEPPDRP